jgi:iron complex outermembrane receptor protein
VRIFGRGIGCFGWAASVVFALALGSTAAIASPKPFSIDAEEAPRSLLEFGRQSALQILFASEKVKGIVTNAVHGNYEPIDALRLLLKGTPLVVSEKTDGVLVVEPQANLRHSSSANPVSIDDASSSTQLAQSGAASGRPAPGSDGSQKANVPELQSKDAEKGKLDEIIVTARRREENINSVPVAITALTGEDLRSKNVETAADLQNYIPSLSVSSSGPTRDDYTFAIRGMGPTGGSGPGAVLGGGGTGVVSYFAEVPSTGAGPGLFYDLENVQVAEGPQGTLFGKNTTGGVILFVPRKPTDEFEGSLEAGGGDYSLRSVNAVLNVPVVDDQLLVRLSAQVQQRDGFTIDRGPFYPGKDYDNRNFWATRLSVIFRPIDNVENYTIVSALHSDEHGDGFVLSAVNPAGPFATGLLPILAQQESAGIRSTSLSDDEIDKRYNYGIINTTRWSISEAVQFKNIFSYQVQKWRNSEDIDGSPLVLDDLVSPGSSAWHTQVGTYTEEPQVQGAALAGNIKWTAGAYYEDGHNIAPQPYEVEVAEGNFIIRQVDQTNSERSRGLYSQATFDFGLVSNSLEKLKLTTGYRYTWDNYGYGIESYSPSLGNACLTSAGTYPQSDCPFSSSGTSSGSSWTLGLDYQFAGGTLLYIRSSKGYVPGGFNPSFGFTPGGVSTPQFRFAPESVIDVELGAKSEFTVWGAPAQLDADVFHSNFSDIQRLVSETLPGGVESNFTANASAAVIEGFELQGSIRPVTDWKLAASYSYNYGKYTEINPAAAPSLVGIPFAYLPASKASLSAAYTPPLDAASGQVNMTVAYSYQSRYFDAPAVQPLDYISAYGLLNIRLEWNNIMRSSFDASFFVSNATNKVYRVGQYSNYVSDGYITSFYGEPRMFGAQVRYRFGVQK